MERLDAYRKFIELKRQEKELKAELDALKKVVYDNLIVEDRETITIDGAEFTVGRRPSWQFSPAVEAMREELKALEGLEKANKTAMMTSEGAHVKVKLPKVAPKQTFQAKPKRSGSEVVNNATGEVKDVEDYELPFAD